MHFKDEFADLALANKLKKHMTFDQFINFVNTPYKEIPRILKVKMTQRPQRFRFINMKAPEAGFQKETFAARMIKFRVKYHFGREDIATIANEFARDYGTRVTLRDIRNYELYNICPKIDKMTAIAEALGLSVDYFAGYGPSNRKSKNETIEKRINGKRQIYSPSYLRELAERTGIKMPGFDGGGHNADPA